MTCQPITESKGKDLVTISKKMWLKAVLDSSATIAQAIQSLNLSAIKIVMISNDDGVLEGTITDGDIRRGLLKGLDMNSPITEVVNRKPLVAPVGLSRDLVLQLMGANKIHQIPIVDARSCIVGIHLWDEIIAPIKRPNIMVVMAGGQGSRLRPHTENCPKPLLPVAGKPILEHIIERSKLEGFTHFIFAVHYLAHMIEDHFGRGERFGVQIDYLREKSPLGTAGALSLLNLPSPDPFVVINGDVISDIRFGELIDFHERNAAAATMAVHLHEWQHPFGVVHTKGVEIVGFEEKPVARTHINAGIYVLSRDALKFLNANEHCDMPDLFERLQEKMMRTVAYPMHEPWLDVGRPSDLNAAQTLKL